MNVCLDNIVFRLQTKGGISVYWYELLKRMLTENEVDPSFIEGTAHSAGNNIFRRMLDISQDMIVADARAPLAISRYLPVRVHSGASFVFHSSYYRTCFDRGVRNVVTVYDFMYERFARGFRTVVHHKQKGHALACSDAIVCISESTRKDLFRFFPRVDTSKVRVVHLAASEEFRPSGQHDAKQQPLTDAIKGRRGYVIYVGNRKHHKNFDIAVKAVSRFSDLTLVAVGGGGLNAKEGAMVERLLGNRFCHLVSVDVGTLNSLYNDGYALLYPSSYEGFGIPILEAMQSGCPVISVNSSSIPEIAGDACCLAPLVNDLPSIEAICDAIDRLSDTDTRASMIQRGLNRAAEFSWDRCFKETLELYRELI